MVFLISLASPRDVKNKGSVCDSLTRSPISRETRERLTSDLASKKAKMSSNVSNDRERREVVEEDEDE